MFQREIEFLLFGKWEQKPPEEKENNPERI